MSPSKEIKALEGFNFKTSIFIRFADIDLFGHVNNALYLTYFEIARTAYWKEIINWNWDVMGIIIANAEISYLKPIRLNDEIRAYVKTSNIGKTSFTLKYVLVKVANGEEELCTTGSTICVTFDYVNNKPAPIPEDSKLKMETFEALKS
ncbi:MAG: thioesterase [Sphingobacteriales bacterium]|nr:thioesterase [Sphingobacteriales bacterium]